MNRIESLLKPEPETKLWLDLIYGGPGAKYFQNFVCTFKEKYQKEFTKNIFKLGSPKKNKNLPSLPYSYFNALVMLFIPPARDLFSDGIFATLELTQLLYPNAKIIVVAAGLLGSWGTIRAFERYPTIRIDKLILFNAPISKTFPWKQKIESGRIGEVINFNSKEVVGTKFMSIFFGFAREAIGFIVSKIWSVFIKFLIPSLPKYGWSGGIIESDSITDRKIKKIDMSVKNATGNGELEKVILEEL